MDRWRPGSKRGGQRSSLCCSEPAGDAVGAIGVDFASLGVEYVYTVHLNLNLIVHSVEDFDVRLAKNYEQVAFASVLQIVGHVQVGVHAGLEDRNSPKFVEFRRMGVEVEGAGDKHVEIGIAGFSGSMWIAVR